MTFLLRDGFAPLIMSILCAVSLSGTMYGQTRIPPIPMRPPGAESFPQPTPGSGEALPGAEGEAPKLLTAPEVRALSDRLHRESIAGYLKAKCFACHSEAKVTAGLNLQRLMPDFVTAAPAETWRRVYERMRDHEMPPGSKPDPVKAALLVRPGFPPPSFEAVPEPAPDPRQVALNAIYKANSSARHLRPYASMAVQPIAIGPGETGVRRLMIQKRNTLAELFMLKQELAQFGRVSLEADIAGNQDLTRAELALATVPEHRIFILRRQLEFARMLEDNCYTRYEAAAAGPDEFYAAKDVRLAAQIELEQALGK